MTALVSYQTALRAPHVGRIFCVELVFPDETKRLHNGYGDVDLTLDGTSYTWRGMSDPLGGVLVSMSEIEDPRFGSAPTISIALTGVDAAYLKSIKDIARDIEGLEANVYFCVVDPEEPNDTGLIVPLTPLFPFGRMTAPALKRSATENTILITIESFFQSQNYPFGGKWSDVAQQKRYPGDLGLSEMGTQVLATRQ
jgi:hypothetical protein